MSKKLHECEDRDEAHKVLESVLEAGEHPAAECRDTNRGVTEVWSGPAVAEREGQVPAGREGLALTDDALGRVAELVADKLAKKLGVGG